MAASSTKKAEADCWLDPRWRLSNLYWITDKSGRRVKFEPNASQLQFMDEMHVLNIILKARQLGMTTFCSLMYLDACVFTPDTRAGIIAHRMDDAKVIFRDKVKFPYDQLDEGIKSVVSAVQDSADTLTFSNNSSLRVSTSMRSGTLQWLHVSEFGKICAQYPEKAREIVTGALNAVDVGQFVTIESTAEGQEGAFYDMTQRARAKQASGQKLSEMDYKFHFYPWWQDKEYSQNDDGIQIGADDVAYFTKLEAQGVFLSQAQKKWYVKKAETLSGDMRREYPSTPDEAFEQALEGAYFTQQIGAAYKTRRIGSFPIDTSIPVNSFWDLGRNDLNTIWLHQFVEGHHRFVGYYENSGEYIGHYVSWLKEWGRERQVVFGEHYVPHDGRRQDLFLEEGRMAVMERLGFRPQVVARSREKTDAIEAARSIFSRCQFDEADCQQGLKRLRHYRKEWDGERGIWRDTPRHDENSHGADAFMTFACSGFKPTTPLPPSMRTNKPGWVL
jgi:hypothetical protein